MKSSSGQAKNTRQLHIKQSNRHRFLSRVAYLPQQKQKENSSTRRAQGSCKIATLNANSRNFFESVAVPDKIKENLISKTFAFLRSS